MTRSGKVLSVFMSICLLALLAVIPGQAFGWGNVYRQLPLYCFLEKKAAALPVWEDEETYERIVKANGEYLGKLVQEEQRTKNGEKWSEDEKQLKEEKWSESEKQLEEERRSEGEEQEEEAAEASVLQHPELDLSSELLADPDYLLEHFFIEDEVTQAQPGILDAAGFLETDLRIKKDASVPQILIYHSHASETFANSRTGRKSDTVVGVGSYLTRILREKYGYNVVHVKEAFDMASGTLDRSSAYDYAREYLEKYLAKNPSIEVLIDLHRDGVPEDRHLVTEISGKKTAQIMFYNGLSYTKKSGRLDYLPNPYIKENLALSFQMEYLAAQYYPDFYRCIYLAGYRYNLHLRPRSMLLEVGAQNNTLQEARNAMPPFAKLLNQTLSGNI